jgi:AcrR family transcriptional regulator
MPRHRSDAPPLSAKGEKTRADIIDSAKALFYERGYNGTSFSDIVEAAGVYRGNIYHYFKSKDDILEAVVARRLDEFRAMLESWDKTYPEPEERLVRFLRMIADSGANLVRYGCPVGTLNTELGKKEGELRQSARALFDLFRGWLGAQFAALGHEKEAEALALHLLGRAQGISVIAHVYEDGALLKREVGGLEAWIHDLASSREADPPALPQKS